MITTDLRTADRWVGNSKHSLWIRISYIRVIMTVAFGVVGARYVQAQISSLSMDRVRTYSQVTENATFDNGSIFSASLNSTNPTDFTSVVMTYPGAGSTAALSPSGPGAFDTGALPLTTNAAMDAAYPFGVYDFSAVGPMGPASASFDYSSSAYPLTVPSLAGSSYSRIQQMDTSQPLTLEFSPFVVDPKATNASISFEIINALVFSLVAFDQGSLPASTTSLTIPAGTLYPNAWYYFVLTYSDQEAVPSAGATSDATILFESQTGEFFSTTPEPSSAVLLIFGTVGGAIAMFFHRWHRSRD